MASFFSKPTCLLLFHVFFGCPRFSCPSLQNPMLFSNRTHHPSSTHTHTISLHSPLPSEPLFPSIPTSPLGSLSSFSPSILHYTLLSPLLTLLSIFIAMQKAYLIKFELILFLRFRKPFNFEISLRM